MNKSEILEHYNSSLNKWEEILNLVKNDKAPHGGYEQAYWSSCGFCLVHECIKQPVNCPLDLGLCQNYCGEIGIVLSKIDHGSITKEEAVSEIQDFIKLIKKIIKERK